MTGPKHAPTPRRPMSCAERSRKRFVPVAMMFGIAAVGASEVFQFRPRVIWNASASAPIGLYWVQDPKPLARGDLVLAGLPQSMRPLAAERHYLPSHVNLIKHVEALAGDQVCSEGMSITIDGIEVASRLAVDHAGRSMPLWTGCRSLKNEDVFLLMKDVPASFDGRYFGVTSRASIIGRLVPLWIP